MQINDLIDHSVKHGLCSRAEYTAIVEELLGRGPCNLLVFGVGVDSVLWAVTNRGGRTHFLEDDPEWIYKCFTVPNVHHVRYRTEDWDNTILHPPEQLHMDLPPPLERTSWDVVFVDAPVGAVQGRMKSIHNAARLAAEGATVFVHDYNRPSERLYVDHYFEGKPKITVDHLVKIQC